MKKALVMGLIVVMLMSMFTGCIIYEEEADGTDGQQTEAPEEATEMEEPAVTLDSTKFEGIGENLVVKKADIVIDGKAGDWSGIESFEVTKDMNGNDLTHKGKFSVATDGVSKLYILGKMTAPGPLRADKAKDQDGYWEDDVIEVFIVPTLPKDVMTNREVAMHYVVNSQHVFEHSDLQPGMKAANVYVKDGEWMVEMEIDLTEDCLAAIKDYGCIFVKITVEVNSGSEYYLFGRTGGFWDLTNYIRFDISQDPAIPLDPAKFEGVGLSIDLPKANIVLDGNDDDWAGIQTYEVTTDMNGDELTYKGKFAVATDGESKLFIKGTMTAPGAFRADKGKSDNNYWEDDVFEVFIVPTLPKDATTNRVVAMHYVVNSQHVFDHSDLQPGMSAANISLEDGEWVIEMQIDLTEDCLAAIKEYGCIFVKITVEVNSAGQYYLFGRTGQFWDMSNYIKFVF